MRTGGGELHSWKEIAAFLDVSVRTAQSWEHDLQLPVQRMPGAKGRVLAQTGELAQWRARVQLHRHWWARPGFLIPYAETITVILAALLCWWGFKQLRPTPSGPPSFCRIEVDALVAADLQGRELWRSKLPAPVDPAMYSPEVMAAEHRFQIHDIDGDQRPEVLFAYNSADPAGYPAALYCWDSEGRERWRVYPGQDAGKPVSTQMHMINHIHIVEGQPKRILALACRLPEHTGRLFELDASGKELRHFLHHGHLNQMELGDVDGDGVREILIGGVDGDSHEATLEVLTVEPPSAASREIRQKAEIWFPRSCLNRKLELSNRVRGLSVMGPAVTVSVAESSGPERRELVYQFGPGLRLNSVWFTDAFSSLHRNLEAQGILDHTLRDPWQEFGTKVRIKTMQ
jgi:hypothetical protein